MSKETKIVLTNVVARSIVGALSGAFIGAVCLVAMAQETLVVKKIIIASGGVITAHAVGNVIDDKFNEMLDADLNANSNCEELTNET